MTKNYQSHFNKNISKYELRIINNIISKNLDLKPCKNNATITELLHSNNELLSKLVLRSFERPFLNLLKSKL
jgi:NurA-like 5'-3' nuclease